MKTWVDMSVINKLLTMAGGSFIVCIPVSFLTDHTALFIFSSLGLFLITCAGIVGAEY